MKSDSVRSCTPQQQQVFYSAQLYPEDNVYNLLFQLSITGQVDVQRLARAFEKTVLRHPIFRSKVEVKPWKTLSLAIDPQARPPALAVVHVGSVEEERKLRNKLVQQSFDLHSSNLFRASLLQFNPREYKLLFCAHHLIMDGVSWVLFAKELLGFYEGQEMPLPDSASPGNRDAPTTSEDLSTRTDAPWLTPDFPRPGMETSNGILSTYTLSSELLSYLTTIAQECGSTLFRVLYSAFGILCSRLLLSDEVVIGTTLGGRTSANNRNVGFFSLPIALDIRTSNTRFHEVVERLNQTFDRILRNQEACRTVANPRPNVSSRRRTLSPLNFIKLPDRFTHKGELSAEASRVFMPFALNEISVYTERKDSGIELTCVGSADLYRAETLSTLLSSYEVLLHSVIARPDALCSELLITNSSERYGMGTSTPCTATTIHAAFELQAQAAPEKIAIRTDEKTIRYSELSALANRIAQNLVSRFSAKKRIALVTKMTLHRIAAALAIWKAGCVLISMDETSPAARNRTIFELAKPDLVLCDSSSASSFGQIDSEVLSLETLLSESADGSWNDVEVLPEDTAAIFFTSGTTGVPKGISQTHANIVQYLTWVREHYELSSSDVVLQLASPGYDASLRDTFGSLISGSTLYLLPESKKDPVTWQRLFQTRGITCILSIVPALLQRCASLTSAIHSELRLIVSSGEPLTRSLCLTVRDRFGPRVRIFNQYGPTECTMTCTAYEFTGQESGEVLPAGKPIPGCMISILDLGLHPVPSEFSGEIVISGAGVSRGYLDATQEEGKFIVQDGNRMFRTGDIGRFLPDGNLEILGRRDHQVKIHGVRVEPAEIEATLGAYPDVLECAVVDVPADHGRALRCFVVLKSPDHCTTEMLRSHLADRLPQVMIPSQFDFLPRLPLTPTGKVDRSLLRQYPSSAPVQQASTPTDALESMLEQIWSRALGYTVNCIDLDFFQSGGTSLQALQIILHQEILIGRELPLSLLLTAPTIRKMAANLREIEWDEERRCIVPIQPTGSRTPLFCFHPNTGHVLCYTDLAKRMAPDQPVYGLQARLEPGWQSYRSLEESARFYADQITAFYPDGPYLFTGASFGGLLAYEAACQLKKRGHRVSLVALLDTAAPDLLRSFDPMHRYQRQVRMRLKAFHRHVRRIVAGPDRLDYLRPRTIQLRAQITQTAATLLPGKIADSRILTRFQHLDEAAEAAKRNYRPECYSGKVLLLRSQTWSEDCAKDLGWQRLVADELEIQTVPGNHTTMIEEPNVQHVANPLQRAIDSITIR